MCVCVSECESESQRQSGRQWGTLDLDADDLFRAPHSLTLGDQLPALRLTLQLLPASPSSEASSKWLDAHYDPMANIHTFSACLGESLGPGAPGSGGMEESDNGREASRILRPWLMALLCFPVLADLHGDGEYKVSISPQQREN